MWQRTEFHYVPSGQHSWARTHAAVPTPLHLGRDTYRVYFATRDEHSRSRVGYLDIALGLRPRLVGEASEPVLDLGRPGHFDCDGVYAMSIVKAGPELLLYYGGWTAGQRGIFYAAIGLARSTDGGASFERVAQAPILGRDEVDPWACLAPCVLQVPDGSWRMWYVSGLEIGHRPDGSIYSRYETKTAVSDDGLKWRKTGRTAIALGGQDTNIGRPCVLLEERGYRAWYPYVPRGVRQYRIGYAESADGFEFVRMDDAPEAGLRPARQEDRFDSEAVAYPYVIRHDNRLYMLYNGNGNGRTGLGIAVWA